MKSGPLKTSFSALLAVFFGAASVYPAELPFWERRRAAAREADAARVAALPQPAAAPEVVLKGLPPLASVSESLRRGLPTDLPPAIASVLEALPPAHGTARRVALPRGAVRGVVLHVQDAHRNASAQRHISGALSALFASAAAPRLLALEGSSGVLDLSGYRAYPARRAVRMAADLLLRGFWISGAAHALLTSEAPVPPAHGVDDEGPYLANVDAYRRAAPLVAGRRAELKALAEALGARKPAAYNPALLAFDSNVQKHRAGAVPLGDHARFLADVAPAAVTPAVRGFLAALDMERALDFGRAEAERARLIEKLAAALAPADLRDLAARGALYKAGRIGHAAFYSYLREAGLRRGVDLSAFPAMEAYVHYVLASDAVDAEALFHALRRLEAAGYAALARSSAERAMVARDRALHLAAKLVDFALIPEEWAEYAAAGAAAAPGPDLAAFEDFYRAAVTRDAVMAERFLSLAPAGKDAPVSVLVTGGFHAPGLEKRLKDAGLAVVSFMPRVEMLEKDAGSSYLSAFTQEKAPLDKLFEGRALFLSEAAMSPAVRNVRAPAHVLAADAEAVDGKEGDVVRGLTDVATALDFDVIPRADGAAVVLSDPRTSSEAVMDFKREGDVLSGGEDRPLARRSWERLVRRAGALLRRAGAWPAPAPRLGPPSPSGSAKPLGAEDLSDAEKWRQLNAQKDRIRPTKEDKEAGIRPDKNLAGRAFKVLTDFNLRHPADRSPLGEAWPDFPRLYNQVLAALRAVPNGLLRVRANGRDARVQIHVLDEPLKSPDGRAIHATSLLGDDGILRIYVAHPEDPLEGARDEVPPQIVGLFHELLENVVLPMEDETDYDGAAHAAAVLSEGHFSGEVLGARTRRELEAMSRESLQALVAASPEVSYETARRFFHMPDSFLSMALEHVQAVREAAQALLSARAPLALEQDEEEVFPLAEAIEAVVERIPAASEGKMGTVRRMLQGYLVPARDRGLTAGELRHISEQVADFLGGSKSGSGTRPGYEIASLLTELLEGVDSLIKDGRSSSSGAFAAAAAGATGALGIALAFFFAPSTTFAWDGSSLQRPEVLAMVLGGIAGVAAVALAVRWVRRRFHDHSILLLKASPKRGADGEITQGMRASSILPASPEYPYVKKIQNRIKAAQGFPQRLWRRSYPVTFNGGGDGGWVVGAHSLFPYSNRQVFQFDFRVISRLVKDDRLSPAERDRLLADLGSLLVELESEGRKAKDGRKPAKVFRDAAREKPELLRHLLEMDFLAEGMASLGLKKREDATPVRSEPRKEPSEPGMRSRVDEAAVDQRTVQALRVRAVLGSLAGTHGPAVPDRTAPPRRARADAHPDRAIPSPHGALSLVTDHQGPRIIVNSRRTGQPVPITLPRASKAESIDRVSRILATAAWVRWHLKVDLESPAEADAADLEWLTSRLTIYFKLESDGQFLSLGLAYIHKSDLRFFAAKSETFDPELSLQTFRIDPHFVRADLVKDRIKESGLPEGVKKALEWHLESYLADLEDHTPIIELKPAQATALQAAILFARAQETGQASPEARVALAGDKLIFKVAAEGFTARTLKPVFNQAGLNEWLNGLEGLYAQLGPKDRDWMKAQLSRHYEGFSLEALPDLPRPHDPTNKYPALSGPQAAAKLESLKRKGDTTIGAFGALFIAAPLFTAAVRAYGMGPALAQFGWGSLLVSGSLAVLLVAAKGLSSLLALRRAAAASAAVLAAEGSPSGDARAVLERALPRVRSNDVGELGRPVDPARAMAFVHGVGESLGGSDGRRFAFGFFFRRALRRAGWVPSTAVAVRDALWYFVSGGAVIPARYLADGFAEARAEGRTPVASALVLAKDVSLARALLEAHARDRAENPEKPSYFLLVPADAEAAAKLSDLAAGRPGVTVVTREGAARAVRDGRVDLSGFTALFDEWLGREGLAGADVAETLVLSRDLSLDPAELARSRFADAVLLILDALRSLPLKAADYAGWIKAAALIAAHA